MTGWKFIDGSWSRTLFRFWELFIIAIFIIVAIFAPLIAPTPADHPNPYMIPRDGYFAQPEAPSAEHLFGTTQGQYDIFYGVIWGTHSAFRVALVVMGITLCIGILLGSLAGYFGGLLDEVIMRITDIFLAFPWLILAMALTAVLGPSLRSVMTALIIVWWPSYARLVRGDILQLREEDYIEASRGLGASSARVIIRHVLPNAIYPTAYYGLTGHRGGGPVSGSAELPRPGRTGRLR